MPASSKLTEPNAAAEASPSPAGNKTPAPNQEEKGWFSLRDEAKAKQFAFRLKANAQWMMRFLHGGK